MIITGEMIKTAIAESMGGSNHWFYSFLNTLEKKPDSSFAFTLMSDLNGIASKLTEALNTQRHHLNEMFHIANGRLVKTSNDEPVPDDEPVFILRGRDACACAALTSYINECQESGTPADRLESLGYVLERFRSYAVQRGTKIPGVTHGR